MELVVWAGLAAAVGLVVAACLTRWLARASYRRDGDQPRINPSSAKAVACVVLPGSWAAAAVLVPVHLVPAVLAWVTFGVVVSWVDVDVQRIPDSMTKIGAVVVSGLIFIGCGAAQDWDAVWRAAVAALTCGLVYLVLALVFSVGLGDVKLAAVTGILFGGLGWSSVLLGLILPHLLAAIAIGAFAVVSRGVSLRARVPFGPAIVAGGILVVLATSA